MQVNQAKAKLRAGGSVRCCAVGIPHPSVVEIIGHSGIEAVSLDAEHRAVGVKDMDALLLASRAAGVTPFWRTARFDEAEATRALDVGYQCFVVPHIRSAEDAGRVIRLTQYAPRGNRGVGPGRPIRFGLDEPLDYLQAADDEILVALMIEEPKAVEDIEAIVAVEGVELVQMGFWDLSVAYGVPLEERHPRLVEATEKVLSAAQARGVWVGVPPVSPDDMHYWESRGARFFEIASAEGLLAKAAKTYAESYTSQT